MKFYKWFMLLAVLLTAHIAQAGPGVVSDMSGNAHDIDRLTRSGQNVALVFWQTWCASCLREAPHMAKAAREYGEDIQFFGVVSGPDEYVDEQKVKALVRKYELPYPQVRDRDLKLTHDLKVKGTPTIIVLGKEGRILYRGSRAPKDWTEFVSDRRTASLGLGKPAR